MSQARPYWNDHVAAWSKRISSQSTQTSIVNSEEEMSNKKCKVGASLLSYTRKKQKVEEIIRSLKICVYPNAKQKIIMKQWMGCARVIYNMVVEDYVLNKKKRKKEKKKGYKHSDFKHFRDLLKERIATTWFYMKKVPANILDETIKGGSKPRSLLFAETLRHKSLKNLPGIIFGSAHENNYDKQLQFRSKTAKMSGQQSQESQKKTPSPQYQNSKQKNSRQKKQKKQQNNHESGP
ncbi:hypothetical protein G9A89_016946 [Geosiphon pyriformis]|nr:hypothetical protein G9A89_016946 [Geosiphon pyriformis]